MSVLDRFQRNPKTTGTPEPTPTADAPPSPTDPAPLGAGAPSAQPDDSTVRQVDRGPFSIFTHYTTPIFGAPPPDESYYHGHVDGAFDGDAEAYRQYVRASNELAHLERRQEEVRKDYDEARESLGARRTLEADHDGAAPVIAHLRDRERRTDEDRAAADDHLRASEDLEKSTRAKSSWMPVWLYGLATVAFLLGDVIVSKQVVAQVLELPDTPFMGVSERWWFAIGIALLAMVVKLGYERLVEKPYFLDLRKRFAYVIGATTVFTLLTLGLLGWTRAHYTDEMKRGGQVSLADAMAAADAAVTGGTAEDAGAASEETPMLIIVAFVSTAVLFAVAGGVCGGVAAQAWHVQVDERYPSWRRLVQAQAAAKQAKADAESARNERVDAERVHAERERKLRTTETVDVLAGRVQTLRALLDDLHRTHEETQGAVLLAGYDSGYGLARANHHRLHPDEHGWSKASGDGQARPRAPRARPHLWIRNELSRLSDD